MTANESKAYLGVGVRFPIQVDPMTGRMQTTAYEEDITEAIRIILLTRKGERIMRPEFGCGIYDYTFAALNFTNIKLMENEIKEALIMWEPRVTGVEISIEPDLEEQGRLNVHIGYVVRSTNNPYNLVYPYYLNEGI